MSAEQRPKEGARRVQAGRACLAGPTPSPPCSMAACRSRIRPHPPGFAAQDQPMGPGAHPSASRRGTALTSRHRFCGVGRLLATNDSSWPGRGWSPLITLQGPGERGWEGPGGLFVKIILGMTCFGWRMWGAAGGEVHGQHAAGIQGSTGFGRMRIAAGG